MPKDFKNRLFPLQKNLQNLKVQYFTSGQIVWVLPYCFSDLRNKSNRFLDCCCSFFVFFSPLHVRIFTFLPDLAQMLLNPTFVLLRFILFKKLKKNQFNCWEGSILQCFDILSLENPYEFIWNCKSGRNVSWLKWKWSGAMCVYSRYVLGVFNPITW